MKKDKENLESSQISDNMKQDNEQSAESYKEEKGSNSNNKLTNRDKRRNTVSKY